MPNDQFNLKLSGDAELDAALKSLGDRIGENITKRAMRKAVKPIEGLAKALAPVRLGWLKRSIGSVVDDHPSRPGVVFGITGVKTNMIALDPTTGRFRKLNRGSRRKKDAEVSDKQRKDREIAKTAGVQKIRPSRYAHLVEFGTKPHRIGNLLHPGAKPKPFLRPAFFRGGPEAQRILGEEIWAGIRQEIAKHRGGR